MHPKLSPKKNLQKIIPIISYQKGEYFGEEDLLFDEPRNSEVISLSENTALFKIKKDIL